jgi:raffinose/stachyose/melibiose transport system permease protein
MTATIPDTQKATAVPVDPHSPAEQILHPPKQSGHRSWWLTIVLFICSLTVLVPLYFTIAMSLKTSEQAASGTGLNLPWPLHFENFATAWTLTHFPKALGISLFITAFSVAGEIIFCSIVAYAIARNFHRRLFRWSFIYLLAAMFIPFPVIALPQIKITALIGLDNPIGVMILHILFGLSFNVLLYSAFIRSIPMELEESARLDGATTWGVFWKLIFPLLAPMNATVGIFAFLASWNDFMMPSLITSTPSLQTLPVVQNIFNSQLSNNYNVAFASYLMAMLPSLIGYLIAQRWVMSGMLRGAIK